VKNHILLKHIPIIVLCSEDDKDEADFAYQQRANCFIVKPGSLDELKQLVREVWEYWSESATLYIPK
jgi:DNA-binding NarL/FixJ family response regulator